VAFVLEVGPQWREHVGQRAAGHPGLVPVVKGNGYGFGRAALAREAATLGVDEIAVGTVHELAGIEFDGRIIVLTPVLASEHVSATLPPNAVFTIGNERDRAVVAGHSTIMKIAGSMRRYGFDFASLPSDTPGDFALHLPLDASSETKLAEVNDVASRLADGSTLYVSHLSAVDEAAVRAANPAVAIRQRVGTALWLGDKADVQITVDVADVRPVRANDRAGYRQGVVTVDGSLVMVTAGTAHGVGPLPDGRSPFHFARNRLTLHEHPHMHTSMLFVPTGASCPAPGDRVEVQQPLTRVWPDKVEYRPLP
jgi:Alanine racemase, N-terminal domain